MEPFEPAGVVWTPVSRSLVTARRIGLAVPALFTAVPLAVGTALAASGWWAAGWVLWAAVFGAAWVGVSRQARSIGYAEREGDLLVRKGVLARTLVVVPYGRLQYVDVQAGPIDRWLGIATVQLHTASAGTDASIPGLPPHEAAQLRDRLARRGEARLAGL